MANTTGFKARVEYEVTDGTQTTYTFPFSYLRKKFVMVSILHSDDTETTLEYGVDYTVNDLSVSLTIPAQVGEHIIIYRQTSTDKIVTWNDGSILLARDMNKEDAQMLHLQEEQQDYIMAHALSTKVTSDKEVLWDALNHRVINVSDPKDPQDAVTKNYMETVQGGFVAANTILVQEATKQALAAKSSQEGAKTSETNASASASASASSASASATSAANAHNSEIAAANSARQQQSDWDVDDDSVTSYIKNKPVLGYYIDTKYGLTNDNFTEKFSDFLAQAVENDKIALLTQTYTVNDAIKIRADKVMLDAINGKLIGAGSIDFRAVKELYCRNIKYSITMKFNYRGDEEYKQKYRKIWIENCDAFDGSVQENFGLYISTPEPANGYSDRNQQDYTKYGVFLDNYSGYNALMIVNKSLDDTGATITGAPDNSALGILDRVTGVASPAVLIDTTRSPFRVVSPDAPPNDTIHQVAFDMSHTGNISIGCSTLNADSSFKGSYNIKIFNYYPTIAMKSGKYNMKALMYVDNYLGFNLNGATVLKISSSCVTSIRNGNDIQLRLEGRNGNAVGLLVDDDGNLRISKYQTSSQDKDQPRLLYASAASSRPTLTHYAGDVGYMLFDKNLGKPIWWTGKNWVDATGAPV